MKINLVTICLILISNSVISQTKNIAFETGTFSEIKARAKKENKLIFIDAYTTWCGPCKWMAKNVFTNDTVADYFNSSFINAKIDMEKGEGIDIAKMYAVQCYPNLLFIDGDGKLVHRGAGAMPAGNFIAFAETAQDPDQRFVHFTDQYESKKNDSKFLTEYLSVVSQICLPFDEIVVDYFKTQKDEDLNNRTNWNTLKNYTKSYSNREFKFMLENIDSYYAKYTADSVNAKIKEIYVNSGFEIIYNGNSTENDYMNFKSEISKTKFSKLDEVLFELDMAYFNSKKEWTKFADLAVEKGDLYYHSLPEFNNISWSIYEHSDDKKALTKAASWMKKSIADTKDHVAWYYYDTYAALLFKLGNKADAKTAADKAIEVAKADGATESDYQGTTDLLKEIEKLK